MKKNLKTRAVFLILFLFSMAISLNINISNKNQEVVKELDKKSKLISQSYNAVTYEITQNAISTSSIIYQDEIVIETIKQALNSDEKTQKILREALQNHLSPLYEMIKSEGVVSFHFVLPNRLSFLRVHQPQKYGDNISSERFTYDRVYRINEESFGLEDGVFNTSFRHVFPLFDEDNIYIGAFEISYSLDYIRKLMKDIDDIETKFFYGLDSISNLELKEKIKDGKPFSVYKEMESGIKVFSYLPLYNAKGDKILGYLTHESTSDYIENILEREKNKIFLSFITLFVFFALLYRLTIYQQNLAKERERFQLAIDSSNDGIWDWKID
ncbi:MAG: hypothetical protein JXQ66_08000, partial [Campylobacterales bacterium]|nr:hypothetical protein [Campylobacterales bacterium]